MDINARVQEIMKDKGHNNTSFARAVNIKRSSISHVISGRNKPGVALLQNILEQFPDINPSWLMLGKGRMYLNERNIDDALSGRDQTAREEEEAQLYRQTSGVTAIDTEGETADGKADKKTDQAAGISRITVYFNDKSYQDFYPD